MNRPPPLDTVALISVPPANTPSSPPFLSTVPLAKPKPDTPRPEPPPPIAPTPWIMFAKAEPPEETISTPITVVRLAIPPDLTNRLPPLLTVPPMSLPPK